MGRAFGVLDGLSVVCAAVALLVLSACNTPARVPPVEAAPLATAAMAATAAATAGAAPVTTAAAQGTSSAVPSASAAAAPGQAPNGDADGDGIADERDACPREPGPRAADAGVNGCPRFVRWHEDHVELRRPIEFEIEKATIRKSSIDVLLEVRDVVNVHREAARIEIQGHYPSGDHLAISISAKRAKSVLAFLVHNGVDAARLTAHGYGEDVPIADWKTAEGRAKNRRIEIRIRRP